MGTAKFFEKEVERKLISLADLVEAPLHPSIAASRAKPVEKSKRLTPAFVEAARRRAAAKLIARKAKQEAQRERRDAELARAADPALRLRNERLLKHIRLLEGIIQKQKAEIGQLRKGRGG